ncbi:MAG: bud neck involved protein [Watsoniomyces obsoletus]|nr:MAG: bud neck involved protein [Watsoniomyces obsoletus]
MAALVQPFPQQSSTVTLLQQGPVAGTSAFSVGPSLPAHSQHSPRSAQVSRAIYAAPAPVYGGYRAPAQTYAQAVSQTPPSTAGNMIQGQSAPHLRTENRTVSAPGSVMLGRPDDSASTSASASATESSSSTTSSKSPMSSPELMPRSRPTMSRDDSSIATGSRLALSNRPLSSINLTTSTNAPPSVGFGPTKPAAPERYRRTNRRSEFMGQPGANVTNAGRPNNGPSGSGMVTVGHLYDLAVSSVPPLHQHQQQQQQQQQLAPIHRARSSSALGMTTDRPAQIRTRSVDDLSVYGPRTNEPVRYRRRSSSGLDAPEFGPRNGSPVSAGSPAGSPQLTPTSGRETPRRISIQPARPEMAHQRNSSGESVQSARSNHSRAAATREQALAPQTPLSSNPVMGPSSELPHEMIQAPAPRTTPDAHKRLTNPSPLSRPVVITPESPSPQRATAVRETATPTKSDSPAVQQLAELNDKDANKKGVKSRLRRAFSFGSAAELRRASAQNSANHASAERARLRKERYQDEQEAEQAAIVQQQEAGGIGEGIYSGQGNVFTGSSDNLSVSSTASSASIMIRKMGKGMKKSTRSLVGLFRPRSIVGVPAAEGPVAANSSTAEVSMVTVEAERVNVNADPHDQAGGGSSYPKLERNSVDAARATEKDVPGSSKGDSADSARSRRSIVGGDFERAEVLAAVKKGILKRRDGGSNAPSPVTRPLDARLPEFQLPAIPHVYDSPHSSAPSTPADENASPMGHRRTDSVRIEGEDYFASLPRPVMGESKSNPDTPQSISKFSVTFSPRIQFHDTWPSGEYDRRGEVATCNRLTPMLAQQIKEELNTFKMVGPPKARSCPSNHMLIDSQEMEVHEQSKVYTHFF